MCRHFLLQHLTCQYPPFNKYLCDPTSCSLTLASRENFGPFETNGHVSCHAHSVSSLSEMRWAP